MQRINRIAKLLKLAQDNAAGEAPVLITVSAFQMGPSYLINIKGVAATSEILWAKQFMGGEEKLEEAKKYIAEDLKKVYPSVKIDTAGVMAPITPAMLGL